MNGCTSFRKGLAGLTTAALLLSPLASLAQVKSVVDDCEGGTNQNKFLAYWYFYDDSNDGGNSTITNSTKGADGTYAFVPTASEGNSGTAGAKLAYQMGTTKPGCGAGCTYGNMVGIGTMLATEGNVLDITGATKVTYWAKASAPMTVRVEVACSTVTDFAYHRSEHDITTTWAQYTINLNDPGIEFRQPDWTQKPMAFDPKTVQKIQWQISTEYPSNPTTGSLILDDIELHGYEYDPSCKSCKVAAGSWGSAVTGQLLSNFDGNVPNKNSIGYYWYCYNDAEGRAVADATQYSNIFGGVTPNETEPTKPVIKIEGNGQTGNGAFIEFELGPTYTQNATTIQPFVGVGTMLSDNLGTVFYNATSRGATGVYFDYKTTGSVDFIRLEVKANQDFGNAGIVHSALLKKTDGQWQGAKVMFTDLKLPDWEEVKLLPDKSLKLAQLAKLQWAFQGTPGAKGTVAIDNVGLIGASNAVVMPSRSVSVSRLNATMLDRGLSITCALPTGTHSGTAELIGTDGRVVAQRPLNANGGTTSMVLPTGRIGTGVYILKISTNYGQGKSYRVSAPITIVK